MCFARTLKVMSEYKAIADRLRSIYQIDSIAARAADAIETLMAQVDEWEKSYDLLAKQGQEVMDERDNLREECKGKTDWIFDLQWRSRR